MVQNSDDISQQLAKVADELKNVAEKLEKGLVKNESRGVESFSKNWQSPSSVDKNNSVSMVENVLNDFANQISKESRLVLQTAIKQIGGVKPEGLDPDQLYGWTDSLRKVLGTTASAPTSEVRKLDDLINQLSEVLDRKV